MRTARKQIGVLCATLLGCGIVALGSTESVQAGHKRCTARKNGRSVLCSGSFGYHPTCWRTWPDDQPTCPPMDLVFQPVEKSVEGTRRAEDSPKVRIEGDAKSSESVPTSPKADKNGTKPISVP